MMLPVAARPPRQSFREAPSSSLLGGGDGVDGGHQAFHNAELIVDNLGHGSQAVGGAGGVGHEGHVAGVLVLVDAA